MGMEMEKTLNMRLTEEEKRMWWRWARKNRMSLSQLVRFVMNRSVGVAFEGLKVLTEEEMVLEKEKTYGG